MNNTARYQLARGIQGLSHHPGKYIWVEVGKPQEEYRTSKVTGKDLVTPCFVVPSVGDRARVGSRAMELLPIFASEVVPFSDFEDWIGETNEATLARGTIIR